jgi:hypothetical protein
MKREIERNGEREGTSVTSIVHVLVTYFIRPFPWEGRATR